LVCITKFLYRNAMYELMGKLELRDEEIKMYQNESLAHQQNYD
jgi:hypothetical protein